MKTRGGFTVIVLCFLLVGCSNTNASSIESQREIEQLTEEVKELKEVIAAQEKQIDHLENFSYLNEFTEDELHAYDLFLTDYDVTHLKEFSPEKIVLLYYHSLANSDLEAIYAVTYDGGTLPDYTIFSDQFYSSEHYLSKHKSFLVFRNYNSIQIREENQTDNNVAVEININFGTHQSTEIFEVQKENDQWKLVLQHLL